MRIGAFEIDLQSREYFSLAEVRAGRARLLRSIYVRNVRGNLSDWMKLGGHIGGKRLRQTFIRSLPVDTEDAAQQKHITDTLTLPRTMAPGLFDGEWSIHASSGEQINQVFHGEVLPASILPTDFAHAALLSAWVSSDDMLRAFTAKACTVLDTEELCEADTLHVLYDALAAEALFYQPVPSLLREDYQRVSGTHYTLKHGGSCADLSLLMASLLTSRGLSPALMLYRDHLAVGCFVGSAPAWETCADANVLQLLCREGKLLLTEITGVCKNSPMPYEQAQRRAVQALLSGVPCVLVNVLGALRGGVVPLDASLDERRTACPFCGCDDVLLDSDQTSYVCPACSQTVQLSPKQEKKAETPAFPTTDLRCARFVLRRDGTELARLLMDAPLEINLPDVWENRPLVAVGNDAFRSSHVRMVWLPNSVTRIGDRAFADCRELTTVRLPDQLVQLSSGAFASSGIQRITVPGSVKRIPVHAFNGCKALMEICLQEGLEEIDDRAFADCPMLRAVCIPSSVKRIRRSAFDSACQLTFLSTATVIV